MPEDIAFLHTSSAHVRTFDALMRDIAADLRARHSVREELLVAAQREGVDSPALVARVRAALSEVASFGASVVVCTCSTVGGIAEDLGQQPAFHTLRVDRAMADEAVRQGGKVLLVATLPSTVGPSEALLQSSCRRLGLTVEIEPLVVASAWSYFEQNRETEYLSAIVAAVMPRASTARTIVLAQASMAPAAGLLSARGVEALSSSRLGVAHAVSLVRQRRRATR